MKEIIGKFKFRSDPLVIGAPHDLATDFKKLGCSTSFQTPTQSTDTLVFISNNAEFIDFLTVQLKNVEPDSVLWFAYPKGSSGVKTDINRDSLRMTAETFGITTVTAISINDVWSALRFRPIHRVGK
jgi:hypothetical protein